MEVSTQTFSHCIISFIMYCSTESNVERCTLLCIIAQPHTHTHLGSTSVLMLCEAVHTNWFRIINRDHDFVFYLAQKRKCTYLQGCTHAWILPTEKRLAGCSEVWHCVYVSVDVCLCVCLMGRVSRQMADQMIADLSIQGALLSLNAFLFCSA